MKHWIYISIISVLSAVVFWQWLDEPEPQVIVQRKSNADLIMRMAETLAEADAIIDICYTTHSELKYNLSLCEADYVDLLEEKRLVELDPIIIEAEECEVEAQKVYSKKKKQTLRHMFTLMASTRLGNEDGRVNIDPISDSVRFVPGLGYQYFVSNNVGVGIMYQPKATAGLTFSVRF